MPQSNNGTNLWALLLGMINMPGAIVAGGCIRDYVLDVAPKDIDIFVPCSSLQQWLDYKYGLVSRTNYNGQTAFFTDIGEGQEYDKTDFDRDKNPLYGVLESDGTIYGHKINIIARTKHADNNELVSNFDFGILKGWFDGKQFKLTDDFMRDLNNRRATLMHNKHIEQSLLRFMRFNTRNPGLLSLNLPFEYDYVSTLRSD